MGFKILLTENASAVGAALFKALEHHPHSVICPEFDRQDWCDERSVNELLDTAGPAMVVNTLSYLDGAAQVEGLQASNVLAKLCARRDLTVVHLSSFEVFGMAQQSEMGAANESLCPVPDSDVGEALRQVELAFEEVRRCIVLRLSPLLDSDAGMVEVICRALCSEGGVVASEHWRLAPVFIEDVVRTVVAMLQQILCGAENWGVYHLHSSDACSEAELVDCVARSLNKLGVNVAALTASAGTEQFFRGNGWLQGNRCTNDFGVQKRSWRNGIKGRVKAWVDKEVEVGRLVLALGPEQEPTQGADSK